jgi:tetrahydromethanopterin S-methyltransferase subunit B
LQFIKDIEKNEKNIKNAIFLKDEIIKLEKDIELLKAKIAYRVEFEKNMKIELENSIKLSTSKRGVLKTKIKDVLRIKERFLQKAEKKINHLKLQLDKIEELQKEFTQTNLNRAKELILQKSFVENQKEQIKEQIIKLQKGFEDAIRSIDTEIKRLDFIKNYELQTKKQTLINQRYAQIQEDIQRQIEQKESEFEKFELNKKQQILQNEDKITNISKDIQDIKKNLDNLHTNTIKEETNKLQKEQKLYIEKNVITKEIQKQIEFHTDKKQKLKKQKNNLVSKYKKENLLTKNEFEAELKQLDKDIKFYQTMIETKEGSFKEFLEENVLFWEERVYPIFDEKLLDMSIAALKPKLTSKDIINLEVDTTNLKKILPKDEAKNQIEDLKKKKALLKEAFLTTKQKRKDEYRQKLLEIKYKKEEIDAKLISLNKNIHKTTEKYQEELKILKENYEEFLKSQEDKKNIIMLDLKHLQNKIEHLQQFIKQLDKNIQEKRQKLKQQRHSLKFSLEKNFIKIQKEIEQIFKKEIDDIDTKISNLEAQKQTITKDIRLYELQKKEKELQSDYSKILKAEHFLDKYREKQSFIAKRAEFSSKLYVCEDFKKRFVYKQDKKIKQLQEMDENLKQAIEEDSENLKFIERGLSKLNEIKTTKKCKTKTYLFELNDLFIEQTNRLKSSITTLRDILQKLNGIKGLLKHEIFFDISLFEKDKLSNLNHLLINLENLNELQERKITTLKKALSANFENFVKTTVSRKLDLFSNAKEDFTSLVAKINKNLKDVDFGVIKEIKLQTSLQEQDSIAKLLVKLNDKMLDISSLFHKDSLFFDLKDSKKALDELEAMFSTIKKELKTDKISLIDTIELSLNFKENNKQIISKSQIKNESSTGGSMLLKIAIAISILQVYIKESKNVFFLIVDEVARLHSQNQKRLKEYANSAGFKIIFVTPEPVFANTKELKYYKFIKAKDQFMAIELNK